MQNITLKFSSLKPQYSLSLMVSIGQEWLGSFGSGSPSCCERMLLPRVGIISKASWLSCLVLGWEDLTRGGLEQMGFPGHLSPSSCGISMQTFQHGEFEVARLHTCWLRTPKVHVPWESPRQHNFVYHYLFLKVMQLKSIPLAPMMSYNARAPIVWSRRSWQTLAE